MKRDTATSVDFRSMGGVEAAKLARAGEKMDIVALASKVMRDLEAEGHIVEGQHTGFRPVGDRARGPGRRAGGPPSTARQAVKQAMREARRLCYSTGPSGDHFKALCEKWGLANFVLARALKAPPGVPVATLVAKATPISAFSS